MVLTEFFFSGLAILAAGSVLTRCADRIAELSGLGRVLVGSLFLAAATSLPELAVDMGAVRLGSPDLAAGDLMGSSLMNLLILSVLDCAGFSPQGAFGHDSRHHAFAALLSILLTAWIGLAAASGGGPEFLGAGLFAWSAPVLYVLGLRVAWLERGSGEAAHEERAAPSLRWTRALIRPAAGYGAAALVILVAAPRLAASAERLALISGLGQTFIGTTALALVTSLPELVATVTAFRIGAADLAMGNIFGSNAFNMILFLPLDLALDGSFFGAVQSVHALTAFAVIAVSTLAVMGQVIKPRRKRWFLDPSAEVIALLIGVLFWLLYRARGGLEGSPW